MLAKPLEILAEELGTVAGQIERETGLRVAAAIADLKRIDAERELRFATLHHLVTARLASLKDGERGPEGPQGPQGIQGGGGEPGAAGPQGPQGDRGLTGSAGPNGETGPQGLTGESGERGGVGPQGTAGPDGRSFTIRGTYQDGESYSRLDVVSLNGASFAANRDKPGLCPGDGWQLIAKQGERGKPGEHGRNGKAAKVEALSIDGEGLLTLRHEDGSTVVCDLYPLLAKIS